MRALLRFFARMAGVAVLAACAASPPAAPARPASGSSADPGPDQAAMAAALMAPLPVIDIGDDPMLGAADAPVTVVEFIDYECPYCQRFARDTFPQLKARYIDTGKVRYVARDLPLPKHSRARPAAIAAACAGEQGRFWDMHEALLAGRLAEPDIAGHARALRLDSARFEACRREARHGPRLDADLAAARALGVAGTPSFLVGASAGAVARGRLLQGDEDYAAFAQVLDRYLGAND